MKLSVCRLVLILACFVELAFGQGHTVLQCDDTRPVYYGYNSFCMTFQGQNVTYDVYVPASYMAGPWTILIPGRNGYSIEYALMNAPLANGLNTILITPEQSNFTNNQQFFGNIFPEDAWDPTAPHPTLLPTAVPNPPEQWWVGLIPALYKDVVRHFNGSRPGYYVYGDDAGGSITQLFNMLWYYQVPEEDRPIHSAIGVSSSYTTTAYPIFKRSYLREINESICFTGNISQLYLLRAPDSKYITRFAQMVKLASMHPEQMDKLTDAFLGMHAEMFSPRLNPRLNNFKDRRVYRAVDINRQLPFPYGLEKLVPGAGPSYRALVEQYLTTPITWLLPSRDTNVWGGVTTKCHNVPNLNNDTNAEAQGPYRVFRGINHYMTGKALAKKWKSKFNWKIAIAPGIGHNSVSMAQSPILPYAMVAKSAAKMTELVANIHFSKVFQYPPRAYRLSIIDTFPGAVVNLTALQPPQV